MPQIPTDLEGILRTLAQIYAMQGSRREVMILARSKSEAEQSDYDNWNGGTYTYSVLLRLPTSLYAQIEDDREAIEKDMLKRVAPLLRGYSNEYIGEFRICLEIENDSNWRQNAVRWLSATPMDEIVATARVSKYDAFISHASDDKDTLVRPLAAALAQQGFRVWYDEFELKVGDSLRQRIDHGLASSTYGIVVLSHAFFAKNWPRYELDGLTSRQMVGEKVILPIWHNVTKDEIMHYSPTLADRLALSSSDRTVSSMVTELAGVLKGKPPK
jgi:TIR domain